MLRREETIEPKKQNLLKECRRIAERIQQA